MVLLRWIFDNHTVEARLRRLKSSTERRPHHHRNPSSGGFWCIQWTITVTSAIPSGPVCP